MTVPRYLPARPARLGLEALAAGCGVHPDLLRRFVALSLLEADRDAAGRLWFTATAPAAVARIQRLHTGLPLNYAAIGLVMDLLERIDRLEAQLRSGPATSIGGSATWIRTG